MRLTFVPYTIRQSTATLFQLEQPETRYLDLFTSTSQTELTPIITKFRLEKLESATFLLSYEYKIGNTSPFSLPSPSTAARRRVPSIVTRFAATSQVPPSLSLAVPQGPASIGTTPQSQTMPAPFTSTFASAAAGNGSQESISDGRPPTRGDGSVDW